MSNHETPSLEDLLVFDIFFSRVTPSTFDTLVERLANDPVSSNNSQNAQLAIEDQVAITLYRFGHDGNAVSLQCVAHWAGVGKGTVSLCTRRVMTALLRPDFRNEAVRFPPAEEKEEAKQWVKDHSCKAWRSGWCLVDGTLIPLAEKPNWYGESYFDRKSRYSMNVQVRTRLHAIVRQQTYFDHLQVVSLPNLRIIDFTYGHCGSTSDASAWEATLLAQEHDDILEDGEWV